jgi:hypothetical protein
MPANQQTVGSLIPWQIYINDMKAKSTVSAILAAQPFAGPSMKKKDTNCIVLWHSLCIMLLADFRMFELAAGRHGAGPAAGGLDNISEWSRTMAARRACLHAAQIFKLMSDRKVSDNVTMHSVTAVFSAALTLALYLFMANPPTNHSNRTTVELIEAEPDWTTDISDIGFTTESLEPEPSTSNTTTSTTANNTTTISSSTSIIPTTSTRPQPPQRRPSRLPSHDSDLSPLHHFIRYGGTVSLAGVPQQGGYESARRTLLDFANLMDGISGRKLRTFPQVLHIMADDLMIVDLGG